MMKIASLAKHLILLALLLLVSNNCFYLGPPWKALDPDEWDCGGGRCHYVAQISLSEVKECYWNEETESWSADTPARLQEACEPDGEEDCEITTGWLDVDLTETFCLYDRQINAFATHCLEELERAFFEQQEEAIDDLIASFSTDSCPAIPFTHDVVCEADREPALTGNTCDPDEWDDFIPEEELEADGASSKVLVEPKNGEQVELPVKGHLGLQTAPPALVSGRLVAKAQGTEYRRLEIRVREPIAIQPDAEGFFTLKSPTFDLLTSKSGADETMGQTVRGKGTARGRLDRKTGRWTLDYQAEGPEGRVELHAQGRIGPSNGG